MCNMSLFVIGHRRLFFQMSDVFNVVSHDDDHMTFIWLSESSGYHHLELVESQLSIPPATLFNRFLYQAHTQRKQLTTGPWVVMPTEVSRHVWQRGPPTDMVHPPNHRVLPTVKESVVKCSHQASLHRPSSCRPLLFSASSYVFQSLLCVLVCVF